MLSEVQYCLPKFSNKPNIRININEDDNENQYENNSLKIKIENFLFENSLRLKRINLKEHQLIKTRVSVFYRKLIKCYNSKNEINKFTEINSDDNSFIMHFSKSSSNKICLDSKNNNLLKFSENIEKLKNSNDKDKIIIKRRNIFINSILKMKNDFKSISIKDKNINFFEYEEPEIVQAKIFKKENKTFKNKNKFQNLIKKYHYNNTELNKSNISVNKLKCYTVLSNIAFKLPKT